MLNKIYAFAIVNIDTISTIVYTLAAYGATMLALMLLESAITMTVKAIKQKKFSY
jgi:hypothetical protein